jgi:hypothetical protein
MHGDRRAERSPDRRRPVGAALVEIACDLGLLPCHDLWRDLAQALREHGGNLVALLDDSLQRTFAGPRWQEAMRITQQSVI